MVVGRKLPEWMRREVSAIARDAAHQAGTELMQMAERLELANAGKSEAPVPEPLRELIPAAVAHVAKARQRWLEPLQEEMDRLIAAARDGKLDDAELTAFLSAAAQNLPDLFARLNHDALANALEDVMGAAAATGMRKR